MYQIQLKTKSNYLPINIGYKKTNRKNTGWFMSLFQSNSNFLVNTNQRYQYQYMNRKRKYQEQK